MKRVKDLDVLKGLAITAVIIIHTTGSGTVDFGPSTHSYFMYLALNRLTQFAVPTFIFASSVLLSYVHANDFHTITAGKLKDFYIKRFVRIIPPYMIWTLLYLFFKHAVSGSLEDITLKSYLKCLCIGTGYYHLYFIVIIIQLYIFMPYIMYCISKLHLRFGPTVLISAALQAAFYYSYKAFLSAYLQRPASLLPWYMVLVFIGTWIGTNYEEYTKKERHVIALLPITIVTGVYYTYLYHLVNIGKPISTSVFNFTWYVYVTTAALLLLYASTKVRIPFFENAGKLSFGIYLMHPLFLNVMNGIFSTGNVITYHAYTLFEFLLIYTVSYLLTSAIEKTPFGKYIVG